MELPTPASVIERIHVLAKGMPALPIFTDCAGHVIGDVKDVYLHNIDMVQEQDVDVDFDFAPANDGNVEPPLVDIPPPVNDAPVVSKVPTDEGTRRSTQIRMQPKPQYIPAVSGKSSSFATTALGTRMLDDVDYSYNQSVVFSSMKQLSVKAAFRDWGDNAKVAGEKEVNQLHWREMFVPRQMLESTNGSGIMKVSQGKVHKILGMTLDFATSKIVKVTMLEYVDEIIGSWDKACSELNDRYKAVSGRERIATAAPDDLFKVDEDAVKLDQARAKAFHNIVAKGIYVAKRARPDISLSIAFLTTRVKGPDIDTWRKLCHLVEYLRSTHELPLILMADGTGVLSWYVDASSAVHPDMRGHTGGVMTVGTGFLDEAFTG
jgi:hypothetical protein